MPVAGSDPNGRGGRQRSSGSVRLGFSFREDIFGTLSHSIFFVLLYLLLLWLVWLLTSLAFCGLWWLVWHWGGLTFDGLLLVVLVDVVGF